MVRTSRRPRLLVLGVHSKSEAYPNTLFRLNELEASGRFDLIEIRAPLWHDAARNRCGRARWAGTISRAVAAHLRVLWSYLLAGRPDVAYVPYPAVFVLLTLGALPSRLRPGHIVADAFISLYDTIVIDRQLIVADGTAARLLLRVERKAYALADQIVTDTPQDADFLCTTFGLAAPKVASLPLATDETHFIHRPYSTRPGKIRVLFVGTLVPLHGVGTILEAAGLLADRRDIELKLIGNGQDGLVVERWLPSSPDNLTWLPDWQPGRSIADEIADADICLGIFGTSAKTQRVCPYKLHAYASIGRAIVTGDTAWARHASEGLPDAPFEMVPVGDAAALAVAIAALADHPQQRHRLATASRSFYESHLANRHGLDRLERLLLEGKA
jgi:glycosyltransferase involved in cell wall biosynthesis